MIRRFVSILLVLQCCGSSFAKQNSRIKKHYSNANFHGRATSKYNNYRNKLKTHSKTTKKVSRSKVSYARFRDRTTFKQYNFRDGVEVDRHVKKHLGIKCKKYIRYTPFLAVPPFAYLISKESFPKQKGLKWCWLACLCYLINNQGVKTPDGKEITQKYLYEKFFDKKPSIWFFRRNEDSGAMHDKFGVLQGNKKFNDTIDALISKKKLVWREFDMRLFFYPENRERMIKTAVDMILKFYHMIGDKPFEVGYNYRLGVSHAVVALNIFDRNGKKFITIGCPWYADVKVYELEKFIINGYFTKASSNSDKESRVLIEVSTIADENCKLEHRFSEFYCDDYGGLPDDLYEREDINKIRKLEDELEKAKRFEDRYKYRHTYYANDKWTLINEI